MVAEPSHSSGQTQKHHSFCAEMSKYLSWNLVAANENFKTCLSEHSDPLCIMIKNPSPTQKHPASPKAPNQDLKDMDVLCTFKIKIESQNLAYGCIKDHWPYSSQDQDAKPQSGTSSILQSPKSGLKGHGCSLHLQNKKESKNSEYGCTKDQWPYPNQYQDAKP